MLACRPMLCFALAVMAGAVTARFRPEWVGYLAFGWLGFLLLLLLFVLAPRRFPESDDGTTPESYGSHILPVRGFCAARGLNRFVIVAALGLFLLGAWRQSAWQSGLSGAGLPESAWFDAHLMALAPAREHSGEDGRWRVPALLLTADGVSVPKTPVLLSGGAGPPFRRGDLIGTRVRRETSRVRAYPGAFDAQLWLERDGLALSLAVAKPRRGGDRPAYTVVQVDNPPLWTRLRRGIDAVRGAAVALTLERGGDSGGMLAAMLYGYRRDVEAEIRDTFRRVGIGHVLAISGLHVGLIVGLLWWASGWLGWSLRWRALSCLLFSLVYLGLAGGQTAAARATLMAVIHLGGIACGRRSDMLNSLGAAAFFLTLQNPSAPLDVSFQLSFTAVVFIFIALHRLADKARSQSRKRGRRSPFLRRLGGEMSSLVRLSVSTWFGLFPIIASVFHQVNPVGLPINIAVIPLMSVVLAGGLLLPCLGWIPGLAWLLCLPARLLTGIALWADALPYSSFPVHAPSGWWLLAFYSLVFAFMLRGMIAAPGIRRRWARIVAVSLCIAFCGLVRSMDSLPPPAAGRIAALPGRGMGTLVAESPQGGIAVVGAIARGGLNEAGWLHFLRHAGSVGVISVGASDATAVSGLSFHNRIESFTPLAESVAREAVTGARWLPVPGAPGVEYAASRDGRGRLAWLAVRTGGKSVCVAPRLAQRQLAWRVERSVPGFDAQLFLVGVRGSDAVPPPEAWPPGLVGLLGGSERELQPRRFFRRRYGALVVGDGILGFNGAGWEDAGAQYGK